jgi:hypothetical protein
MSRGPGLRCCGTGSTAISESTCCSFWERVEEGIWKRYKIGDRVVVARRFRDHAQDPLGILGITFPLPLLSVTRALLHTLTGEHAGEEVAPFAQLRLPLETSSKRIPPDKRILLPAPQSLPSAPGERTDVPTSQYRPLIVARRML